MQDHLTQENAWATWAATAAPSQLLERHTGPRLLVFASDFALFDDLADLLCRVDARTAETYDLDEYAGARTIHADAAFRREEGKYRTTSDAARAALVRAVRAAPSPTAPVVVLVYLRGLADEEAEALADRFSEIRFIYRAPECGPHCGLGPHLGFGFRVPRRSRLFRLALFLARLPANRLRHVGVPNCPRQTHLRVLGRGPRCEELRRRYPRPENCPSWDWAWLAENSSLREETLPGKVSSPLQNS